MHYIESPEARALVASIFAACQEGRPDDAQEGWERLQYMGPMPSLTQVIPAYILVARGRYGEALQHMNQLPDDLSPSTRAMCMRMAGDPMWHSVAQAAAEDPDPIVSQGMRQLLELR